MPGTGHGHCSHTRKPSGLANIDVACREGSGVLGGKEATLVSGQGSLQPSPPRYSRILFTGTPQSALTCSRGRSWTCVTRDIRVAWLGVRVEQATGRSPAFQPQQSVVHGVLSPARATCLSLLFLLITWPWGVGSAQVLCAVWESRGHQAPPRADGACWGPGLPLRAVSARRRVYQDGVLR